jgi:hypothetical protein
MMKQALLVAGAAVLYVGGILAGHFATTGWPGPNRWLWAEAPTNMEALNKLKSELDLSPEQAARIAPIVAEACEKMRVASEEHRAQRLELMDEVSTTIWPDLSPNQQKKLEAMETEMQKRIPVKSDMRIVALF